MSETKLTIADLELIAESLDYTLRAFRDYADYPSYEFKCARIAEVQAIKSKVTALKRRIKAVP